MKIKVLGSFIQMIVQNRMHDLIEFQMQIFFAYYRESIVTDIFNDGIVGGMVQSTL